MLLAHRAASHGLASGPQHNSTAMFDCHGLFDGDLDLDNLPGHDDSGLLLHDFASGFLSHL